MPSRPADIIVIGAGIVGCSIAYELARRGAAVEVVDERMVGMGATQASAGMLAPYIEAREESPLFDLTARSLSLFDDHVARVSADSGITIPYRRTGTLTVVTDPADMSALRETADALARHGVDADLLDGPAAQIEEPHLAADVAGGLLIRGHGFVAVKELTRAVVTAAQRHGAHFAERSRVRRITAAGSGVVVATDRGPLRGNAVVLAAGSWSGEIAIEGVAVNVPVRPVRGQLMYLAWNGSLPRRVLWGPGCYVVPWDDGTVLVGATSEDAGFDERVTVSGVRDLLAAVCAIMPQARTETFAGARAGLRPGTADGLPVIGHSQVLPNLMYATGHYRNGVLLSPLTAQLVADAMLGGAIDPALAVVTPARFGEL